MTEDKPELRPLSNEALTRLRDSSIADEFGADFLLRNMASELLSLRQSSSFTQGYEAARERIAKMVQIDNAWLASVIREIAIPQAPGEKR